MAYAQSQTLRAPSVSFIALLFYFILVIRRSEGNVNLNIRSSTLSQTTRNNEQVNQSGPTKEDAKNSNSASSKGGGVAIDKTGQFNCHVIAPRRIWANDIEEDDGLTPIFRWPKSIATSKIPSPSLHLGAKYDFGTVWYGAT
eukprot:7920835-Ditylum_brightwellii.AAC.1